MKTKNIKITISLEDDSSISFKEQVTRIDQSDIPPPPPEIIEAMDFDSSEAGKDGNAPPPPGIVLSNSGVGVESPNDLAPPPV